MGVLLLIYRKPPLTVVMSSTQKLVLQTYLSINTFQLDVSPSVNVGKKERR